MKTENNINSNSFSDDLHNSIKSEPVDLCGSEVILNKMEIKLSNLAWHAFHLANKANLIDPDNQIDIPYEESILVENIKMYKSESNFFKKLELNLEAMDHLSICLQKAYCKISKFF